MEGPENETTTDSEVEEIMMQSRTQNGTDDGEHKNCVDIKQQLAKVLEIHNNGVAVGDFAWQKQMRPDEIVFSAFVVQGIGEIKVPVSQEDMNSLKQISEAAPCGKGKNTSVDPSVKQAWQINSQKIMSETFPNRDLLSLVQDNFGLPSELMELQANLDEVILYETGGFYERDLKCSKSGNSFAKLILQLPVSGGHEGGRFKVDYKGKEKSFENHQNSDQHFHVSAYYDCCGHAMEHIKQGRKLTFVYNLVWTNVKSGIPQDFPVFITAVNEMKQALSPWIPHQEKTPQDECDGKNNKSRRNSDKSRLDTDMLFWILEEQYDEKQFTFHSLRGKDRALVQLLGCYSFLDMHLTIVTHRKTIKSYHGTDIEDLSDAEDYDDEGVTELTSNYTYSRWIDSSNGSRNLKMNLMADFKGRHVGNSWSGDGDDFPYKIKEVEMDEYDMNYGGQYTTEKQYFNHGLLIIWPKHRSLDFYCRYGGLDSLLDHMETSLNSASYCQPEARVKITEDLRKVISYCCAEPTIVWGDLNPLRKGKLTLRLLNMCTILEARDEGLTLLQMLGKFFPQSIQNGKKLPERFEGIQTEEVAQAIAEFECQVTGWTDIAELIKQLVSPHQITQQLNPITKLAKCFLDVNCVEGAKVVGDCIASSLATIEKTRVKLNNFDIDCYIDFLISMEANSKTSNPERLMLFVSFFHKLESPAQCRLLLELDAQGALRFKGIDSYNLMFQELCQIFTSSTVCTRNLPTSTVLDLLKCYVRFGNAENIQSLVSNLSVTPSSIGEHQFHHSKEDLLCKLLSSKTMWELATTSELGKLIVDSLLNKLFSLLMARLSASQEQHQASYYYSSNELEANVISYLRFVMKMEVSSSRLSSVSLLLEKMSFQQLNRFLVEFLKSSSESFKQHPNGRIIRQLAEALVSRMKTSPLLPNGQNREIIMKVLSCFTHLIGDESLTRTLVEQICSSKIATLWPYSYKCQLFSEIVSSSDMWSKLDAPSKLKVLNACAAVVEEWVAETYQLFEVKKTAAISYTYDFKSRICNCIKLFVLIEKNRLDQADQKIISHVFQPLFEKLTASHLMELLLDLHKAEADARPSIQKFPTCLQFFRDVCSLIFANENLKSLIASRGDFTSEILKCLLWLNDDQSWQSFANKIVTISMEDCRHLLLCFLKRADIHQSLVKSPSAFAAFNRVVDHWAEVTKSLTEPPFTWKQPGAVLPDYPAVQEFLHSPGQSMIYAQFSGIGQARNFAASLERAGLSKGFSVQVTASGTGKSSRCEIVKNRSCHDRIVKSIQAQKNESEELVKLRDQLQQRVVAMLNAKRREPLTVSSTEPDDIQILSPAKRLKKDIPIFELGD